MTRGRVIVVDDHPLFRGALSTVLKSAFEHVEILEAGSMDELSALLSMHTDVELILLDLSIPGVFGL
ncbi:MAG: response regulator, partial [Hyphomicrobiaceae bacterium]